MSRTIQYLLIAVLLIVGIAASTAIAAKVRNDSFAIADVTLGMDLDSVLKVYPSATIEIKAPGCYSYGKAVGDRAMSGRVLRHRDGISELAVRFAAFRNGGRTVRIDYDRRLDPEKFDFRKLLERLTKRYGPHDRVLHRRKMEPAGRVIGFEWQTGDHASLRVVLHEDFRSSTDRYRLSFLARSGAVEPRATRCTSARCSQCITP